ncbi:hypothetical protein M0654_12645 [Rhizobium sp. NTR19]|jgi:hypothetical protein|uniref:Cytochrome c oxidase assembly factor 3 mitochondrial coiled-coil domain-containing protein n=1 Tax=Neorhizobium turbinariae TaxID=2937795 RepID=A0ABT0ISH0_9HYPH|nr:hypothetical protein [Neorhizobium turbinariae]MCK8780833.1 hypothetical protein [Neorhizobium turbinariae]
MEPRSDQRLAAIRRKNRILLLVLVAFVLAVFGYSFRHIGREAHPDPAPAAAAPRP